MKEYLETYLTFVGEYGPVKNYRATAHGKGTVTVEYNPKENTAEIIHIDHKRRDSFYSVSNEKELKDTVEYCLGGKVVSDKEWNQNTAPTTTAWEEFDDEIL